MTMVDKALRQIASTFAAIAIGTGLSSVAYGQAAADDKGGKSRNLPVGEVAGDLPLSPFYRWEKALGPNAGRVLRMESLPSSLVPRQAASAFRLLYASDDWRWKSGLVPVSGALFLPRGRRPAGGWPLVVWAHGTLGVSDACSPSWTGSNPRDRAYIGRWLDDGFAVVAPDYQGLGAVGPHPYLIWQAEGRSVLDAGRAALRAGKGISNRVIITGQSQGSGAALGAARLAMQYAPDLKVMGTIATALVVTFPDPALPASLETPGGTPYYMVYRMMSGGLPDGSAKPETLLTEKGRLLLKAAQTRCDPRVVAQNNDISMENAFSRPVVEIERLLGVAGAMDSFTTKMPLMLGIGLGDELIPADRQKLAMRVICRSGNRVRLRTYPGVRHSDTLTRSADDAIIFARNLLDGQNVQSDCGETSR